MLLKIRLERRKGLNYSFPRLGVPQVPALLLALEARPSKTLLSFINLAQCWRLPPSEVNPQTPDPVMPSAPSDPWPRPCALLQGACAANAGPPQCLCRHTRQHVWGDGLLGAPARRWLLRAVVCSGQHTRIGAATQGAAGGMGSIRESVHGIVFWQDVTTPSEIKNEPRPDPRAIEPTQTAPE